MGRLCEQTETSDMQFACTMEYSQCLSRPPSKGPHTPHWLAKCLHQPRILTHPEFALEVSQETSHKVSRFAPTEIWLDPGRAPKTTGDAY